MFDDPKTPSNLPTGEPAPIRSDELQSGEPEDIFKDVESGVAPLATAPVPPAPIPDKPVLEQGIDNGDKIEVKEPIIASRKVIMVIGIVLGILVISGIAWGAFRFLSKTVTPPSTDTPSTASQSGTELNGPEIPSLPPAPEGDSTSLPAGLPAPLPVGNGATPEPPLAIQDSDGDGLNDEQETVAGTDLTNSDSDSDGLFDGEEVLTYKTDPLDPDTDGDSYLDGQEVRNGYNPNGTGNLFEVPSQ